MVEVHLLDHFQNVFKGFTLYWQYKIFRLQLLNQHPLANICEASHYCIILELVADKFNFFCQNKQVFVSPEQQEMWILAI